MDAPQVLAVQSKGVPPVPGPARGLDERLLEGMAVQVAEQPEHGCHTWRVGAPHPGRSAHPVRALVTPPPGDGAEGARREQGERLVHRRGDATAYYPEWLDAPLATSAWRPVSWTGKEGGS